MNYEERRDKNKLKQEDHTKIQTRFKFMFEAYKLKTVEELKEIFNKGKLSSTDQEALIRATDHLLKQKGLNEVKEIIKEENKEEIKVDKEI